jgi:hypothetical protein
MSNVEGRMSKEGILSILSEKIERSLRLVEAAAPTPRRAIPPFVNRHSIFQSFFFDQTDRFFGRRLG